MTPQRFEACNAVMLGGSEEVADIHAHRGKYANGCPVVITCWRPTASELVKLNLGEAVYLHVMGETMPPVCLVVDDPFAD